MELLPSGMDSAIKMIIREAYALFKLYRARDGERKTFAMCAVQAFGQLRTRPDPAISIMRLFAIRRISGAPVTIMDIKCLNACSMALACHMYLP